MDLDKLEIIRLLAETAFFVVITFVVLYCFVLAIKNKKYDSKIDEINENIKQIYSDVSRLNKIMDSAIIELIETEKDNTKETA